MPIYNNSRSALIEMMLRLPLRSWIGGVADSGSTTTVVDDTLEFPDDYFQNTTPVSRVRILSTTDGLAPKGEEHRITDYTYTTGSISISSDKAFSVAPGAGDTYVILSEFDWDEMSSALNFVIDSIAEKSLINRVDESIVGVEAVYEYALPSDFVTLHRVSQSDSSGIYSDPIDPDQYRIIRGSPSKIKLLSSAPTAGSLLRIEGYAKQGRLTSDDSICYLPPNYVVYKAAALVMGSRVTGNDFDAYKARRDECEKQAEVYLKEIVETRFPPNTKQVAR